jgi:hypothetical protein
MVGDRETFPLVDALQVPRSTSVNRRRWRQTGGNLAATQRPCNAAALLHHADPLVAVEPEVAVGDHGAGLRQLILSAGFSFVLAAAHEFVEDLGR